MKCLENFIKPLVFSAVLVLFFLLFDSTFIAAESNNKKINEFRVFFQLMPNGEVTEYIGGDFEIRFYPNVEGWVYENSREHEEEYEEEEESQKISGDKDSWSIQFNRKSAITAAEIEEDAIQVFKPQQKIYVIKSFRYLPDESVRIGNPECVVYKKIFWGAFSGQKCRFEIRGNLGSLIVMIPEQFKFKPNEFVFVKGENCRTDGRGNILEYYLPLEQETIVGFEVPLDWPQQRFPEYTAIPGIDGKVKVIASKKKKKQLVRRSKRKSVKGKAASKATLKAGSIQNFTKKRKPRK